MQTAVVNQGGVPSLRATVSTQTSAEVPTNGLTSIQYTQFNDASVNILTSGPNNQTAAFTHTLTGSPTQVRFDLSRTAAGTPATVRFIANDVCGAWPSFVGAGLAVPI